MKIEDVEGIGPTFAGKLTAAGVSTTDDLLDRGATAAGRAKELDAARPNWIRQVPGEATIAGWIEQAGNLAKVVSH